MPIFKSIYSELMDNGVEVVQTVSNGKGYTILVDKSDFTRVNKLISAMS